MNTTLYRPGNSLLHRLHPLSKLALAALGLGAAFGFPGVWWTLAFFALVTLPLAWSSGFFFPFLTNITRLIFPFLASLFLIQGFFTGGPTIWFTLGPLTYTLEGFTIAFDFSMRILQGIAAVTLLLFLTRPDYLMLALNERGLPHQVSYLVVTTLQIIPRFQSKAASILAAQQARGLETEGHLLHRLRLLIPLVTPLILGSIIDIDERAIALEARAFSHPGGKTSLHQLADSAAQRVLRPLLLLAALALLAWRVFEALQ
jgi:energy-coupling factor transport system permease protein